MLDRFRVSNFKSLVNVELRPSGLNLFVGANNAGKTNLCHALRFLALTTRMPLDEAARNCTAEPWNLLNVYAGDGHLEMEADCTLGVEGELLRFTYELRLSSGKKAGGRAADRPFTVSFECLKVTGEAVDQKTLLENTAGKVKLLREKRDSDIEASPLAGPAISLSALGGRSNVETSAPDHATMLFQLYDLKTNRMANLFKQYLGSWGYYSLDPVRLRSNVATPMDRVLSADGSNLCSVLYTLHNERPRDQQRLVEAARLVEPRLDLISFQSPDPEHVYMFFEDSQGHRFGVQNLSDGTLRFLAMSFLIIGNRRESGALPAPPLVMIEEPENGLFVGHLKALFERIDPSGTQGQFIFTSHNPYFIDLFDGALDGIHVVKAGRTHSVVVRPAPSKIQERLGKFSLGEMHFRGLLE